jgi:hypothetical protein
LLPILKTAPGIDRLLPLHDGVPEVDYDVDVESMELGHVLRVTPESLAADVPYLHAAPAELPACSAAVRVGLVWSVSQWQRETREIPLSQLTPLMELHGVELHVLQRGPALDEWPRRVGCISGTDAVEQTASLMRALDLVITVDSFPAHLAGALGVPVWTLVPEPCDWRWMMQRQDSPWYPTLRLFRQPSPGDWPAVIARVANELRALVTSRAHAHAA